MSISKVSDLIYYENLLRIEFLKNSSKVEERKLRVTISFLSIRFHFKTASPITEG